MACFCSFLLLLSVACLAGGSQQTLVGKISPGSSLFPTSNPSSWLSPSGRFAFGFYQQDNGFAVGIWLVGKHNKAVVWTANRDDAPVSANSTLALTKDGQLLLRNEQGEEKPIAYQKNAASSASMLDSGNFVLYNEDGDAIWESFEYPTDTILGGQNLSSGNQLVSSFSEINHSTGKFRLKMQGDGNLVLYPLKTLDVSIDAYWSSGTETIAVKSHLFLNSTSGLLQIINTTNHIIWDSDSDLDWDWSTDSSLVNTDDINNTIYSATLDFDGVFRLYSHHYNESGEFNSIVKGKVKLIDQCQVNGFCGFNSFCTFNDDQPYCICLPGCNFIDPNQSSLGCARNYSVAECKGGEKNALSFNISQMENIEWGDSPYFEAQMSIEECINSCLEDCVCGAANFDGETCKKQHLPLRYVRRVQRDDQRESTTALLKVGSRSIYGSNKTIPFPPKPPMVVISNKNAIVQILILTIGLTTFSLVALIISGLYVYKFKVLRYKWLLENGNGLTDELTLQLFSYNELKRATNNFKEELGKGAFGAVYKGSLYKGKKLIAVKRLEKLMEEGEKEFQAEMQSIGRTHHRNLVRLLGYCAVGSKRLLVYEYMSNGSLADLLFNSTRRPDWNERARIALDVARGILYLHEECEAPTIHCDIKPQNILMDDFWTAKISDFGLAKLLMPDQTRTFTVVRGTRGYIAPEWLKSTQISVKADVYSYGIVLLEIICCRKNMDFNASKSEEIILSTWVYKRFVAGELNKLVVGEEVENKTLEKLVKVALWCIQDEPDIRPSMKSVVLMLEGITDISIPPCPTASSA